MFRDLGSRNSSGVEKQRLGDCRLDRRPLERLGDKEGRLGPSPRQEPLGEGGDEDHRHRKLREDVLDRIDAAGVVGQLDIGKHQSRRVGSCLRDRLVAGDGNAGDIMAKVPERLDAFN